MQAVDDLRLTDEELAARAGAADSAALAALYERYLQGLYDFALRIVRDPDVAAGVVETTFVSAWETVRKRQVDNVRPWLYAVARKAALDEVRRRNRAADARAHEDGANSFPIFTAMDGSRVASREALANDRELVSIVWASAAALSAQEYALLDLHHRQRLSADELAENLGLEEGAVDAALSGARGALEEAVVAVLLTRRGRRDCPDLNSLLVELGGTQVTPDVRQAVQDHVEDCERCEDSRRQYVSPVEIFAALAPVPVAARVRERIWERIAGRVERRPAGRPWAGRRIPNVVAISAIVAALAAASAGGSYFAFRGAGISDPSDVASFTHQLQQGTSDAVIGVKWTPVDGAAGYSLSWSREPELPDETRDLPGNASRTSFRATPGQWWFNLRTQGRNGRWTSTVHVGPLVVLALPDTEIVETPGRLTNDSTPTFAFSATRTAGFECSVDGAAFADCPAKVTFASFDDGSHTVEVRARDRFGNADATPARFVLRVDTTKPRVSFTSVTFDDDRATFAFRANEKRVAYSCKLNDERWTDCKSPLGLNGLPEGEQRVSVRARDRAGNVGPPARRAWEVDTIAPGTRITSGPSGEVESRSATFAFTSTEANSDFECSLDGAAFAPCSSPVTYSALDPGAHVFRVSARDEAGNVDEKPAQRRWTVRRDTVRPNTTITSGPSSVTTKSSAKFTFTSEPGATFECRLDGGGWRACRSPRTYRNLSVGTHRFFVRAVDSAGNRDATPASWEWLRAS